MIHEEQTIQRKAAQTLARVMGIANRAIYRLFEGTIGGWFNGGPVLLLTTQDRRRANPGTWPLLYFRDGARIFVVGSNAGLDTHPRWYLNLRAHPHAQVQIGGRQIEVMAKTAGPEDRDRLWRVVVSNDPMYEGYRRATEREIPLVYLDPIPK